MKRRLDQAVMALGLTVSRSQAESYIRLGKVTVNTKAVTKPGALVGDEDTIELKASEQYVSRAGLKLASVAELFKLDFKGKTVLDVGSSTGGFTDYALRHGAKRVIAVDVGTDQLHPSLRGNERIELHEKTNILDVGVLNLDSKSSAFIPKSIIKVPASDIAVMDVSFVSASSLLPHVATLIKPHGEIAVMVKPQFEASHSRYKHKGVIKNDKMRRDILKEFEDWARQQFVIIDKADSDVAGAKGNRERFYLLRLGARP